MAKSASTKTTARQCNSIQANNSNEENSENSQIYSVATVNKITVQKRCVEVHINGKPIEMLVDCVSNALFLTVETLNEIKFNGHKLASSAIKLMDCQSKEIPVFWRIFR